MDKKRKKNKRAWIITGTLAVLISIMVSYYFLRPANLSYRKVKARTGSIAAYYSFSGNVASKKRQSVFSEKAIQISRINTERGQEVKAGDVLLVTADGDELIAEIDGEVALINVQENKQVMPGTLLIEIVDYNELEVVFKVDEYDVNALSTGKEAIIHIPAVKKELKGNIREISKEGRIENGVTFYTASIDIKQDGSIRTGMSAEIRLLSEKAENIVVLPMDVIRFDDQNQPYVLKAGEKNKDIKQSIVTGINDGIYVEIRSGVTDGEEVFYENDLKPEALLFPEGGKNIRLNPR